MLPIQTILHPTDFSDLSNYAFRLACALARDHDGRIVVLHVAAPPSVVAFEGGMVPQPELDEVKLSEMLGAIRPDPADVPVEHHLVVADDPIAEILRLARDIKCDLVVMGTHGRTGLKRALMGSVAEQVLRKAECPVLTVKKPFSASAPAAAKRKKMSAAEKA